MRKRRKSPDVGFSAIKIQTQSAAASDSGGVLVKQDVDFLFRGKVFVRLSVLAVKLQVLGKVSAASWKPLI